MYFWGKRTPYCTVGIEEVRTKCVGLPCNCFSAGYDSAASTTSYTGEVPISHNEQEEDSRKSVAAVFSAPAPATALASGGGGGGGGDGGGGAAGAFVAFCLRRS